MNTQTPKESEKETERTIIDKVVVDVDVGVDNKESKQEQEAEPAKLTAEELFPPVNVWDELPLKEEILRGIYSYGLERPSPIQSKAILPVMMGHDVIAQAQSGTGKTATFTIGTLSRVDLSLREEQVLMVAPTRELVQQIVHVVKNIGSCMEGLLVKTVLGGGSIADDIEYFKRNAPQVVVGCPGRILDLLKRRVIHSSNIKTLVLDEADELLSSDFRNQMQDIIGKLPPTVQIALFSATLPEHIKEVTRCFMNNPVEILVKQEQLTLEGIKQYAVAIHHQNQKYETLKDLYSSISVQQCIIYCNSINRVMELYDWLTRDGFAVSCIHSNMSKEDREAAFVDFRKGSSRILISSNVTSRGIDIQQVSVVINYDIPHDVSNYLHRIGRSGRWGRKGVAINFITPADVKKMRYIEQYYATEIQELPETF
jgi:translation initiation factor 4A